MNAVLEAIYRDQQFTGPDGKVVCPFPVAIKRDEGEAIYRLVRAVKPAATLEIGTAFGLSTLFMCQGLRDNGVGRHVAIDPFQSRFGNLGLYNVRRAGLGDLLTFYEEPSQIALARMVGEKQSFDVVFIDGSHLFDAVVVDFFFADQLIPVGGLLVFDDLWMPSIRKALRFIVRNRHYEVAGEFMGQPGPFVKRHLQNLRYQARKRLRGQKNRGTGSEMAFHQGRNVNWCVLRKMGVEDREWDSFAAF